MHRFTGRGKGEAVAIEFDSGVDLLLPLLVLGLLTESALETVGDVKRMVTRRVGRVVAFAIRNKCHCVVK